MHFAASLGDESSEEDFANETPVIYQAARYDKRNRAWWRWLDWLQKESTHRAVGKSVDVADRSDSVG